MQRLRYSQYFKSIIITIDIVVVALVLLFFFWKQENLLLHNVLKENNILILLILMFFWVLLSGRTKLYSLPRILTYTAYLERLIAHIIIFITGVILLAQLSSNPNLKDDRLILAIVLFVSLFFVKSILFFVTKYYRTLGNNYRNVMFLRENSNTEILKEILIKRKDYGYKIFNFTGNQNSIIELTAFWEKNGIHSIYLPTEHQFSKEVETAIYEAAEDNRIKIFLVPNAGKANFFSYHLSYIETLPILSPVKFPLDYYSNYVIKRAVDIFLSIIILVGICSWLFPIIALLIRLDGKGPIFFRQKRYGFHEEIFDCIKFRTMMVNTDSTTKTTQVNDIRITKIGKFLRKTSLDELPQLINVFLGQMSVVGPRPHMILIDDYYKPKIGRYSIRSLVKPGITGLAQVNGLRGDSGDMHIQMKKRFVADSYYVKNWTFILDLIIILKTLVLLIKGDKNAR